MQSVNYQVDTSHHTQDMEPAKPARPEPFVTDHLSAVSEAGFTNVAETSWPESGFRAELAAAFRKLGRGVQAGTAFEQAKDFYRSSGHDWTRGLSRFIR